MYKKGNEEARPNLYSYSALVNAYAKSRDPEAAQKAEDVLFGMYEAYRKGNKDLKPNTKLVTAVIDCWQRSGRRDAGEKAEALLNWLLNAYAETHDEDFLPNEYTFASTIAAWSKSRKLGKALRARLVLNRMIDLHESGQLSACPNTHCFTAVINSCAYCENDVIEKRNALRIAIATYKDLGKLDYGDPNEVTFSTLLAALRNLLPESKERTSAMSTVFRSAAEDGRVDDLVVRRVQSALTKDELIELFSSDIVTEKGQVKTDLIPNEWRRNLVLSQGTRSPRENRRP